MITAHKAIPLLFVAALCFFGMAFFSILMNSQADDIAQVTTIGNATPVVNSMTTALVQNGSDQTAVTLIESDVRRVYIYGTASDNNGCSEIDQASQYTMTVHRSDVSGSCTADKNNCYPVSATNITIGSCATGDTTVTYEGYVDVAYYADPTDGDSPQPGLTWVAAATVADDQAVNASLSDTFEINSLVAFTVAGNIQYDSVAHGDTSTAESIVFTNTGNRDLDTNQSASGDMVCDNEAGSTIPVENVRAALTADFSYNQDGQALTTVAQSLNLNLSQRTDDEVASTKNLYFRIRIPEDTTISGSCNNTLTFTARADS